MGGGGKYKEGVVGIGLGYRILHVRGLGGLSFVISACAVTGG